MIPSQNQNQTHAYISSSQASRQPKKKYARMNRRWDNILSVIVKSVERGREEFAWREGFGDVRCRAVYYNYLLAPHGRRGDGELVMAALSSLEYLHHSCRSVYCITIFTLKKKKKKDRE